MTWQPSLHTLSPAAQAELDRIGPIWGSDIQKHRDIVLKLYDPLLAAAPKDGVTITRDVAYGVHPRQILDIFKPDAATGAGAAGAAGAHAATGAGAATGARATNDARAATGTRAPVVMFVHGGAFVRGDKRASSEVYDNLLIWFARQGYVGVNIEFRLAPEAAYPGGADDLASSIAWVKNNIAPYGGDGGNIFGIGHSAGGTHVATYAYDPAAGYLGRDLAGIVLISARLAADVLPENPNASAIRAYFGSDESLYATRSPLTHITAQNAATKLPVFTVNAEYENPLLDLYGLEFAHRIATIRRHAPRYLRLTRHNHISIVAHFNTGEELLGREMIEFFESGR